MPRNGSGTFTLASSAFVPGTTISSASVNSDFSDIATALTGSVAADGQTSITQPIRFASGSALLPSITFTSEATTGMYFVSTGKLGITGAGTAIAFFDKNRVGTSQDGNQFTYANTAIPAPVGLISDFGGSAAPLGWLLCSGANFIRANYPELFTVIATNFGSGDGSTTAGLPDLRGRVTVGKDDMGGTAANRITNAVAGFVGTTLGAAGGAQSIIITTTTMPSHAHSLAGIDTQDQSSNHTHNFSYSGSSSTTTLSSLTASGQVTSVPNPLATPATVVVGSGVSVYTSGQFIAIDGINASGASSGGTTNVTLGDNTFHHHSLSGNTGSIGSDAAHINVQPSMIVNKIIFAGRP